MNIDPTYASVGELFGHRPMFFIQKYQRTYAWEVEQIQDFVKDLENCIESQRSGRQLNHFFGGILSVKYAVTGAVNQHKYEIIDGQQRMATFTLLAVCLVNAYKKFLNEANDARDNENEEIIKGRIDELENRFIEFTQEVNRRRTSVEVLSMSRADHPYYKELIRDMNPSIERESHRRLLKAYNLISGLIKEIIEEYDDLASKMDILRKIQNVIEKDFMVLHMVTETKEDAYRLFQVINDRGTNLTDGDLLRAKTLEILEDYTQDQETIERAWDDILKDVPTDTKNILTWIYESHHGSRPKPNTLFDMFLDKFFPDHTNLELSPRQAQNVRKTVTMLNKDTEKCRGLIQGDWFFLRQQPITAWDRTRLNILMVELKHTLSIPLLLAASKIDHRKFSEIVQLIEKVFFRYKVICNKHVTPLKNIYYQESVAIRQDPDNYNVASLKTKLQQLIDEKASDEIFRTEISTIEYYDSGGSNKPLKYFLMAVEYYYQWLRENASGSPECYDKSKVFDFSGTSIEHIYPRSAAAGVIDHSLEPLKNSLGNLTIMDPGQNNIGGNESFDDKKPLYQSSSVEITRKIGAKPAWTVAEIEAHKNFLLDAAVKIFHT